MGCSGGVRAGTPAVAVTARPFVCQHGGGRVPYAWAMLWLLRLVGLAVQCFAAAEDMHAQARYSYVSWLDRSLYLCISSTSTCRTFTTTRPISSSLELLE
jgi:hypothetical protein